MTINSYINKPFTSQMTLQLLKSCNNNETHPKQQTKVYYMYYKWLPNYATLFGGLLYYKIDI